VMVSHFVGPGWVVSSACHRHLSDSTDALRQEVGRWARSTMKGMVGGSS
jgi:hypothetical protein